MHRSCGGTSPNTQRLRAAGDLSLCGSVYDPAHNDTDACLYHPGNYENISLSDYSGYNVYTGARWSCCNVVFANDWVSKRRSVRLPEGWSMSSVPIDQVPGCTRGPHGQRKSTGILTDFDGSEFRGGDTRMFDVDTGQYESK